MYNRFGVNFMCEVCKAEGHDYLFRNGPKKAIHNSILYKVFKDSIANIRLCHIHSIELFMFGERKFLRQHIFFARNLAKKSMKSAESSSASSSFGF